MKYVEAEGTLDATIRKIVWGVPIALVIIGLLILLFAWFQPSCTSTITEVGEISYTPARKMVRGTSDAYYRVMLDVEYNDVQGEHRSATVLFGTTNPNAIPKTGDQILISNGWSGMVTHPNRNLVGIGGDAATIGGLFILMYLLTMLRWKKNRE